MEKENHNKIQKDIFIEPWIDTEGWNAKDFTEVKTPCYVVSLPHLEKNLKILKDVQDRTGAKILLATKGFSMFSTFPLVKKYLAGTEASSVFEARLGMEECGGEVHSFCPSYTEENIGDFIKYSDHLVFNSFSQWNRFKETIKNSDKKVSCGIRVNPEVSVADVSMYDPSSPNSHFGVTNTNFEADNLGGLEGIHFHNLCELNADALEKTLIVVESKFGQFFGQMKWINFGGGHHITRKDYNIELLCTLVTSFKARYPHLEVYLEPGEAVALNAGVLVSSVVDVFKNQTNIAVLDVSATCHMPDVLEIPYLPTILDVKPGTETDHNIYKLVGPTCLTGDIIGEYSMPKELSVGQKLVFLNMAIYTMVKSNTFNGINLPSIATMDENNKITIVKEFDYQDFKGRLS